LKPSEHDKFRRKIGVFIKKQRLARDLLQNELADSVGAATSTISAIERGVSSPSFFIVMKLSRELGFDLEYLAEQMS
jgi:transcriptional regulator with XRE-family HTH domain